MKRRHTLLRLVAATASLTGPVIAGAVQRRSLADPLRLAADEALVDSGLGPLLVRSFGQDTGVAVRLLRGRASSILEALERGEHDAGLTNAPEAEAPLEKQGLVHDRRTVVRSEVIVVGPAALAKPLAAGHDVGLALSRLANSETRFVSRPDGSGTHLAELAAWRAARTAPAGAWYQQPPADLPLLAQAHERNACTIVERGVWAATAGVKGYAVLADGDARLAIDVHVMRSFRADPAHPAGKLFVAWISSEKGRALAAAHRGYGPASG